MLKRKCPVCGNRENGKVLYEIREVLPDNIRLPERVDVVACANCGFCFADTEASAADYDEYYENSNMYAARNTKSVTEEVQKEFLTDLVRQFAGKKDKILDMGSGGGRLLKALQENGFEHLCGMDVAEANVNLLKGMNIQSFVGGAYDDPIPSLKGKVDFLLLVAVLEHLLLPGQSLECIKQYLGSKGRLAVVVPDVEKFPDSGTSPSHHFHHEHINYFSIMSLDSIMGKAGLKRIFSQTLVFKSDVEDLLVAVYEKDNDPNPVQVKDNVSESAIRAYLSGRQKQEDVVCAKIQELLQKNKPVVLWGIGARVMNTLARTPLKDARIEKCIDSNLSKVGNMITVSKKPYRIEGPEALGSINRDAVILICVNSGEYAEEIAGSIQDSGILNEIVVI